MKSRISAIEPTPAPSNVKRFETEIIKPNNDTRVYRGLILPNQLRVMLVSDPTTDKSAGSLSVKVGSLADPWNLQGMAHFLEHALFLTTKKYPEENFFKNFVVSHGGHTNAFTSLTETCYFFDVGPEALEGSLDRFAQFFIEPLFPRDLIERELQSIQFEFENTVTSDSHRFYRVRKVQGDRTHEFSKFETGNKKTLIVNDQLFEVMVKFYQTWYSANIMTLAVFGKESLDELEQMVTPLFGQIFNRNVQPQWIERHPYPYEMCRKVANIVPFKETRKLIIFFPLPDFQRDFVKCDALSYITFLLAHEGPGSLLAQLKELGYCTLLDVSNYFYSGFGFLDIEVNLTQGITRNNEIIQLIFQYIKLLKSNPPEQRIYEEIKMVNEIKFHFRDKFDPQPYVKFLCSNMQIYPFSRVVCGRSLLGQFNTEEILKILDYLTVDRLNLQVVSPIFKTQTNFKQLMTDPIYGTEYCIETLLENQLQMWSSCTFNLAFQLPAPNEFIPHDFKLKKALKPSSKQNLTEIPHLVLNNDSLKVWHLQDSKYLVPKAFYGFVFKNSLVNLSPLNVDIMGYFLKLFYDYINQKFYSADLVGICYSLTTNRFGFEIRAQGFNDKLDTFLFALVDELIHFKINPKRAEIIKDLYYNALKVFHLYPISSLLHTYLDVLLTPNLWTHEELIAAFSYVTDEMITPLITDMFANCRVEVLAHGNIYREEAITIGQKIFQLLTQRKPIIPLNLYSLYDRGRDVQLTAGTTEFAITHEQHENHGFLLFYQLGLQDLATQARLELLHQIISEPYFNQIRMAEQLAYVTFVTVKMTSSGTMGLVILIQSAYSLKHLENRVDMFIESLENILTNMKEEHFNKEKNSLITKVSEQPKSMFGFSRQLWYEIISGQYVFDRDDRLVMFLKKMKLSDVISLYRNTMRANSAKCRRLIITIKSFKCKEMQGKEESQELQKQQPQQSQQLQQLQQPKPLSNSQIEPKKSLTFLKSLGSQSIKKPSSASSVIGRRVQVNNIRKFKCESSLCPIPKAITEKI